MWLIQLGNFVWKRCWANKVSAAKLRKLVPESLVLERRGYLCWIVLLKRQFLGRLDFLRRVETGGERNCWSFTLGDGTEDERDLLEACTLGSGALFLTVGMGENEGGGRVGSAGGVGIDSIRWSWVAKSSRAFLVGSPAANDGTVVDGGAKRMVTMSVAACFR